MSNSNVSNVEDLELYISLASEQHGVCFVARGWPPVIEAVEECARECSFTESDAFNLTLRARLIYQQDLLRARGAEPCQNRLCYKTTSCLH